MPFIRISEEGNPKEDGRIATVTETDKLTNEQTKFTQKLFKEKIIINFTVGKEEITCIQSSPDEYRFETQTKLYEVVVTPS